MQQLQAGVGYSAFSSRRTFVAGLNDYDSLNDLEAGNYNQRYYVEKEGLRINFLSEDKEEEHKVEEVEDDLSQLKSHENPSQIGDILASSSRTFNDLVNITFSHPPPSLGITLKGLASLQTLKSRIDPQD